MRSTSADDRTTRARIRDAAVECFAEMGGPATTARAVATRAGVSPGSVIHHFGSMDALRVACDEHVVAVIRRTKAEAIAQGPAMDPLAALRSATSGPPLLAYLARTITDGSPHVADLLRDLVADAVDHMEQGVASGLLKPVDDPAGCAAVMTIWSLGALVLHEQVKDLLGVDMLSPSLADDPAYVTAYLLPAMEVLAGGLIPGEVAARIRDSLRTTPPTTDRGARP